MIFLYGCADKDIELTEPLGKVTGKAVKDADETISDGPIENTNRKEEHEDATADLVIEEETLEKTRTIRGVNHHDVYVRDREGFNPKEMTINSGDSVSWKNEGHRGMILLMFKDGKQYLHQNAIDSGDTFAYQFNETGSYDIYWNIVGGPVTGKLIVQEKPLGFIDEPVEEPAKKDGAKKSGYYSEEQLEEDLTSIFGSSRYNISNFTRDPSYPDYVRSSELKYHVIHTPKNRQIKTFKEFCGYYCGENWDGWRYYINTSEYSLYIPLLGQEDFLDEKEYEDYRKERVLANHTQKERIYEVENGKVLEYKFWLLQQDNFGNFVSNLLSYIVLYKVYCTPNMTVLIRPRWDDFSVRKGGKITDVIVNWELEDDRVSEELLEKANKILKACPVEKQFFDNYNYDPYFKSDLLSYYWELYYANGFNLTRNIDIGVEKLYADQGIYVLKNINLSFANNDIYSLYDTGLRVTVKADGGKSEHDYYDDENFRYEFKSGEKITKSLSTKEIKFEHNITVIATLYIPDADADVRPLRVTFTKSDLGFE